MTTTTDGSTTAITDEAGNGVAVGAWIPFNGDDPTIAIATYDPDEHDPDPCPVLTLSRAMAVRLAHDLLTLADDPCAGFSATDHKQAQP